MGCVGRGTKKDGGQLSPVGLQQLVGDPGGMDTNTAGAAGRGSCDGVGGGWDEGGVGTQRGSLCETGATGWEQSSERS